MRQNLKLDEDCATHYCKYCDTWGTPFDGDPKCGNCGEIGFLIRNPFPGNIVPYIEQPEDSPS